MGAPAGLSRGRIAAAIAVAITADAFSFVIGPFGFTFADEIVDVAVMGIETWLLGFHLLFLPTFVLEILPVADMIPTWTACVLTVVAIRRRQAST